MRIRLIAIIICVLLVLVSDAGIFVIFRKYLQKRWLGIVYWFVTLVVLVGVILFPFYINKIPSIYLVTQYIAVFLLIYIPKGIFILLYGILHFFLKRNIKSCIAGVFSISLFGVMLHGLTIGKSDYKLRVSEIFYDQLPASFDQFSIVLLSDLHLGSVGDDFKGIRKLVDEVNAEHPDVIFFAGDMVNSRAEEMLPWIDELKRLNAPYGMYAVMGNHDYGFYTQWRTEGERISNVRNFQDYMKVIGFRMLNDTSVYVVKGNDTLAIAGVEYWGNMFRKGSVKKALSNVKGKYTVLISHDPIYWHEEIYKHQVPLTLSGHTHAMQCGIAIGDWEWSPAEFMYPEYDGLYGTERCKLIVSRGQGFVGYPGRVGLRPQYDKIVLRGINCNE